MWMAHLTLCGHLPPSYTAKASTGSMSYYRRIIWPRCLGGGLAAIWLGIRTVAALWGRPGGDPYLFSILSSSSLSSWVPHFFAWWYLSAWYLIKVGYLPHLWAFPLYFHIIHSICDQESSNFCHHSRYLRHHLCHCCLHIIPSSQTETTETE